MATQNIPIDLFDQVSRVVGGGDFYGGKAKVGMSLVGPWTLHKIRLPEVEEGGVVGLLIDEGPGQLRTFALWSREPEGEDSIGEPEAILTIVAGQYLPGHLREGQWYVQVELSRRLDLNHPFMRFIVWILRLANDLTRARPTPTEILGLHSRVNIS